MVQLRGGLAMNDIERAVGHWHRIYALLSVARDRLRRAEPTLSGLPTASLSALMAEVDRLQHEEDRAMQAIRQALQAGSRHGGAPTTAAPGRTANLSERRRS
jgi:hypothetical protein